LDGILIHLYVFFRFPFAERNAPTSKIDFGIKRAGSSGVPF